MIIPYFHLKCGAQVKCTIMYDCVESAVRSFFQSQGANWYVFKSRVANQFSSKLWRHKTYPSVLL